jgi:hypothetical protein
LNPAAFDQTGQMSVREAVRQEADRSEGGARCVLLRALEEIEGLGRQVAEKTAKAAHWKANHTNQVARARILLERPDMPIERVNAYKLIGELQEKLAAHEK